MEVSAFGGSWLTEEKDLQLGHAASCKQRYGAETGWLLMCPSCPSYLATDGKALHPPPLNTPSELWVPTGWTALVRPQDKICSAIKPLCKMWTEEMGVGPIVLSRVPTCHGLIAQEAVYSIDFTVDPKSRQQISEMLF